MTSRDYKAVQDVQLRYDTYIQGRRFDLIQSELFSQRDDIALEHSDLAKPASGREQVFACYQTAADQFEKNGGFLRSDLCTSQVLTFSPDGKTAEGVWLTIGVVCEKDAFGHTGESCPLYRVMGQRRTRFVLEHGQWKIHKISWQQICRLGPVRYEPSKCTGWNGLRERRWELPPTEHSAPWEGRRCR